MKKNAALFLVIAVLWGCASSQVKNAPPRALDTAASPSSGETDSQRAEGLDSLQALFERGDDEAYAAALDLFKTDIETLGKRFPNLGDDEDFIRLLANLNWIDSLLGGRESVSQVDSLALANEAWPDLDSVPMSPLVASSDSIFPVISNERIDFWIRYFTGPGRDYWARTLYRMALYRPTIQPILEELGLPTDLICMAAIESGFSLKARSRARAVGPWQFLVGTARLYGLHVDWWHDQRRDLVASTYAAGNYIKDLYSIWESWPLALAAYNCGEYRVARAVVTQRTTNFWELRLPKQTQRYVPKFLAALYIARNPQKYGFTIPDVEPFAFDEVEVKDATDLAVIAKAAEVDVDEIRNLNPNLLRWCTPPSREISVKIPKGTGEKCEENLAAIPPDERVTWRRHRIRKGETLHQIAMNYGTTVSTLKRLNNIRNPHRIRAGTSIIVPVQGGSAALASSTTSYKTTRRNLSKAQMEKYAAKYAAPPNHKKVYYLVKDGDTLGEIAEEFRTSARKLRAWNNLSYRQHIYPGQRLVIYVPQTTEIASLPLAEPVRPSENDYTRQQYVVKRGDTFHSISKRFNVKVVDLMAWNDKSGRSVIYPGEVLDIWLKK